MKKTILVCALFCNVALADNSQVSGTGDTVKAAKWDAIKTAMITCGGAVNSTNKWSIEEVKPYFGCPDVFEDEEKCTLVYKVETSFKCL